MPNQPPWRRPPSLLAGALAVLTLIGAVAYGVLQPTRRTSPDGAPRPPVPASSATPGPDADQAALTARGWTWQAMPHANISLALPPSWQMFRGGPDFDPAPLGTLATAHPTQRALVETAAMALAAGDLDAVGFDTAAGALDDPGGSNFRIYRWSGYARQPIEKFGEEIVKRLEPTRIEGTLEKRTLKLPIGDAVRITYVFTDPTTKEWMRSVSYVIVTGRDAFGMRLRRAAAGAAEAMASFDAMAASLRHLPGPRRDAFEWFGSTSDLVLAIDASADTDGETLAATKAALSDALDHLHIGTQLAIVAYGDRATVVWPSTSFERRDEARIRAAINSIQAGGSRDISVGIRQALALLRERRYSDIVLTAAGPAAGSHNEQKALLDLLPKYSPDIYTLAVGPGAHEPVMEALARDGFGAYLFARDGGELRDVFAKLLAKTDISGTLAYAGPLPQSKSNDDEPLLVVVGPGAEYARFSVLGNERISLRIVAPSGREVDTASGDPDVRVIEGERRSTIVISKPDQGRWRLSVVPAAGGTRAGTSLLVEQFGREFTTITRTKHDGGAGWPIRTGLSISLPAGVTSRDITGTATVTDPAGVVRRYPLQDHNGRFEGASSDAAFGTSFWATAKPGSYRVLLELRGHDRAGRDFVIVDHAATYMAPSRDSDGDGFPDDLEVRFRMNPANPRDGTSDLDGDGIPTGREVYALGTDPSRYDTDGGAEGDAEEIAAGRNPRIADDDVKRQPCTPPAGQQPRVAAPSPAPGIAPELEALLPDVFEGDRTRKSSGRGPAAQTFFGPIAACFGKSTEALSIAYAVPLQPRGWGLAALTVNGVSGADLSDAVLHRMRPGGEDGMGLRLREVDGRRYAIAERSYWVIYAEGDVLYWAFYFGRGAGPLPAFEDFARDFVRAVGG